MTSGSRYRRYDTAVVQHRFDPLYATRRRPASLTPDATGTTSFVYDSRNLLTAVTNPRGQTTALAYDLAGRRVRLEHGNGAITSYSYDCADRLRTLAHTASDDTLLKAFTYSYDQAGNRRGVVESTGAVTTWTYDKTYQLLREERSAAPAYSTSYSYDAAGNRLTQNDSGAVTTYTYDEANRLVTEENSSGVTTYSYDDDGNRTQKETSSELTVYTWDEDSRLVVAEPVAGLVTLTYRADGRRVQKETPSESKHFIYDLKRLLQETDDGGDPLHEYSSTLEEWDELVSEYDGRDTLYHQYDGVGSTDALLDDDEAAAASYAHRAFGLEAAHTGTADSSFTFVGAQNYYRDPELDLYFAGARYYDPAAGRWLTQDPIGFEAGDENLYRYVGNNPVNKVDPRGTRSLDPTKYGVEAQDILKSLGDDLDRVPEVAVNSLVAKKITKREYWYPRGASSATVKVAIPLVRTDKRTDTLVLSFVWAFWPWQESYYKFEALRPDDTPGQESKRTDADNRMRHETVMFVHSNLIAIEAGLQTAAFGPIAAIAASEHVLTGSYNLATGEQHDTPVAAATGSGLEHYLGYEHDEAREYGRTLDTAVTVAATMFSKPWSPEPVSVQPVKGDPPRSPATRVGGTGEQARAAVPGAGSGDNARTVAPDLRVVKPTSIAEADPIEALENEGGALSSGAQVSRVTVAPSSLVARKGTVTVLGKAFPKEVAYAEELAAKGNDVVVRGKAAAGADFIINGVRWEYKQLEAATINAVRQNIRDALKQASRVIIDGRKAGLTHADAIRAVAAQANAGRMSTAIEVRVLTRTGEYVWRPL